MSKGDAVQRAALERLVPEQDRRGAAVSLAWWVRSAVVRDSGARAGELPEPAQLGVLMEVALERTAQDAKWGQQDHPLVDPTIAGQQAERGHHGTLIRMAQEYEVPTEERAKFLTDVAAKTGRVTFGHIATEEQSEFIKEAALGDLMAARREAIQAAAVWVQVVERIDRMMGENLGRWLADPRVRDVVEKVTGGPVPGYLIDQGGAS